MLDMYHILIIISSVGALFCLIALISASQDDYYNAGYKQGQIDAINNNIKYMLTTNKDSEKVWTKIYDNEV